MQLHPNSFDKGLFTVAVKEIIKQPMTFTKRETEDDDSDGGHDDEDDDDDCNGDNAMLLMIIMLMAALLMVMLSDRAVRLRYMICI